MMLLDVNVVLAVHRDDHAEHGATVASFDRDFARFDDLQWVLPS